MNRRDLLIFVSYVIWGMWGYFHIHSLKTSHDIISFFTLWLAVSCGYLIILIILSFIFPKFGTWGDVKLFKR